MYIVVNHRQVLSPWCILLNTGLSGLSDGRGITGLKGSGHVLYAGLLSNWQASVHMVMALPTCSSNYFDTYFLLYIEHMIARCVTTTPKKMCEGMYTMVCA